MVLKIGTGIFVPKILLVLFNWNVHFFTTKTCCGCRKKKKKGRRQRDNERTCSASTATSGSLRWPTITIMPVFLRIAVLWLISLLLCMWILLLIVRPLKTKCLPCSFPLSNECKISVRSFTLSSMRNSTQANRYIWAMVTFTSGGIQLQMVNPRISVSV